MADSEVEGALSAADGVRLFYRRWDVPQPRGICFLIHGIAEHGGRYRGLAELLTRQGFQAWAMDHRGHGRSGGRRGDCRSLGQFTEDLHPLAQRAHAQMRNLPMVLIGHSLGGLIALSYAVRHPEGIQAVAVSGPALKLTHETPLWKVALVTAVSRLLPTAPFENGVNPKFLCHDPRVVEAYEKDPLVHHVITARCAVSLRKEMRNSLELARGLKIPCLILQGGADEICDPAASAEFSRRAGAEFRRYEGLYHELFNEPEQARVIEELLRWLNATLQGTAP